MAHSDEQWELISEKAKRTHVADLPSGATIIIAHPGQQPNMDPKHLRENFGVTPGMVTTLDKSREAPVRIYPVEESFATIQGQALSTSNGVSAEEHDAALNEIAELKELLAVTKATKAAPSAAK